MIISPLQTLLKSRKFLLLLLDVIITLVLYFTTKYATPSIVEDVNKVILAIQPIFISLIFAIAYEKANVRLR